MLNNLDKEKVIRIIEEDMTIRYKAFLKEYSFVMNDKFHLSEIENKLDKIKSIKKYLEENLK